MASFANHHIIQRKIKGFCKRKRTKRERKREKKKKKRRECKGKEITLQKIKEKQISFPFLLASQEGEKLGKFSVGVNMNPIDGGAQREVC